MHKLFIISALAIISTVVPFFSGCDDTVEFSNTPPGSLSITRNLCYLAVGQAVTLTGEASDADGDSISYSWSAAEGTFSPPDGKGEVVTWTAPAVAGVYRVTLRVTDGIDQTTEGIDLEVGPKVVYIPGEIVLDRTDVPYFIDSVTPLLVQSISTLRILPGVTLIVNKTTGGLRIEGTMIVEGTASDRVTIKPNVCPGDERSWRGIVFSGSHAVGDLSYLNIAMAETGIDARYEAVVACDNVSIEGCEGPAVSVIDSARVDMDHCKVWDNGTGIYVENGIIDLAYSSIRYNGVYGFYMISSGYSRPFDASVDSCVVANNLGDGFVLSQYADPVIHWNSIFGNQTGAGTGFALKLTPYSEYATHTIDARWNYWGVTTEAGVIGQIFIDPEATATVDYSGWLMEAPVGD
jgi:hypothetical protein